MDQTFSVENFRRIVDYENRKGNYLEGKYFGIVDELTKKIKGCSGEIKALKKTRFSIDKESYKKAKELLKTKRHELKKEKENILDQELDRVSKIVCKKSFRVTLTKKNMGAKKDVYTTADTPEEFFALKQVQYNIKSCYDVKQSNRHQIICQIREVLSGDFPKYVLRTDISNFYESIPSKKIVADLIKEPLLTPGGIKIIKQILHSYYTLSSSELGVPRGIGISAYLSEIYMKDFDEQVKSMPGVIYYARFVDDIIIIYSQIPNISPSSAAVEISNLIKSKQLTRNRKKTKILKYINSSNETFDFLGFNFGINDRKCLIRLSNDKVKKYKDRISLTFEKYEKISKKNHKRAKIELIRRIKFLTGNTRLVNNKKNAVSGTYFSNSLLSSSDSFIEIDDFLSEKINNISDPTLRNDLSIYTFRSGYEMKIFYKFSEFQLKNIVRAWKNV